METQPKFGGNFSLPPGSKSVGTSKTSLDWGFNDWRWDGDLFTATPLNPLPSDCRSSQIFPIASQTYTNVSSSSDDDDHLINVKGKTELEKRRKVLVVQDEHLNDEPTSLSLELGGQVYPILDEDARSGKKTKVVPTCSNRAVCQVEDCGADLTNAKDYHRRHKVCDVHSKATKALVGNVMQRFCQQCSKFHILQEFDEEKRSCRRRLAGHNKRRRKTHPENVTNGGSLSDEKCSSYLLISLLRILSNLHANSSDQTKDQDLLLHILRNLTPDKINGRGMLELLQEPQGLVNAGTAVGTKASDLIANDPESVRPSSSASKQDDCTYSKDLSKLLGKCGTIPFSDLAKKSICINDAQVETLQALPGPQFLSRCNLLARTNDREATVGRAKLNNIDLNNVYDESEDHIENLKRCPPPVHSTQSLNCPLWVCSDTHKTSPQQGSGNSDSAGTQSPPSSSGEGQSQTDRIVFKLFGKDPNDFPLALRTQILDWLSHSPTDIESYIRPGCIILTIYLRMGNEKWEEICLDLRANLSRLLDASNNSFWKTGWLYARVRHCVSFIYNGQVVFNTPLPHNNQKKCWISSIKPIAVSSSEKTHFVVKGFNILQPSTRLLCALEGKYMVQETCLNLMDGADTIHEHDKLQCLSFPCSLPDFFGRGFIEVEDQGLSSSFYPFIVAEQEVCAEIRMLEDAIEVVETADDMHEKAERMEAKNQALDFLHEMGWFLHKSRLKLRLSHIDTNVDLFSFERFKWLVEFALDHNWCAVVKSLLAMLFDGMVDAGEHSSIEVALLDMCLLHRAVRRNCRPMVELLLRYVPGKQLYRPSSDQKQRLDGCYDRFIFKPNFVGPGGMTPLHVAASSDGSENVLDALTDDPGLVGIEAWKTARDSTGLSANDYACLRGHYSYIHLVQRKINKKSSESRHVVLDIPKNLSGSNNKQKDGVKSSKVGSLHTEHIGRQGMRWHCKACEQKLAYDETRRSLVYRPAMLSMVAIAAVCVCAALLFKSFPEVDYVFQPFRWELLKYGSS